MLDFIIDSGLPQYLILYQFWNFTFFYRPQYTDSPSSYQAPDSIKSCLKFLTIPWTRYNYFNAANMEGKI